MRLWLPMLFVLLAACEPDRGQPPSPPAPTETSVGVPSSAAPVALRSAFIQRGPGASFGLTMGGADEPFVTFDTGVPGVVSPDGRRIAYFVRDQGDYRQSLQVFDGVTGEVRELVRLQDESPSGYGWAGDSAGLAYGARSNRQESGGVDPPPTYTAVRVIDVATRSPREIARVRNENLVVVGWSREQQVVLGRSGWAEGSSRAVVVAEDGRITRAGAGEPVSPQSFVPSPDRTVSAGRFWSASTDPTDSRRMVTNSGITAWDAGSGRVLAERRTDPDSGVADFAYRPGTSDLVVVAARMSASTPATFVEIWGDHGRATPRRIWSTDDLYSQGSPGLFLAADGTAYVSFVYPGRQQRHVALDLSTGQATTFVPPTRSNYVGTMLVSDAAIARNRRPQLTATIGRADAIARIRALDRNVVRADRIEAKLGSAREVQQLVGYRTSLDVPPDVPVWVVAVSGDVRAFTDTEVFRLAWGAWFLDGRDGRVIGFQGDPRPGWPSFWEDLKDRAP